MRGTAGRLADRGRDRLAGAQRRLSRTVFGTLRPSLVIVGAHKAGTTALFDYLALHPQVAAPRKKELNFFGCDIRYGSGAGFYKSFFPARTSPGDSRITFEATPHYLFAAEKAAPRLRSFDRDVRIIALLRDPVDRAYSAWQMHQAYRRTDTKVFNTWVCECDGATEAAAFRPRREQYGRSFTDDVIEELEVEEQGQRIEWSVIGHGRYADQLAVYFEQFAADQMMIIDSAKMRTDPRSELRLVEEFLHLDHHDWHADDLAPRFVGGYSEPLPLDARRVLADHYRPFNDRLQAMLDREFDWA
ncbi:MAG: sulfotransferase domain-containing protein [Acidimicrobiia bacterium]